MSSLLIASFVAGFLTVLVPCLLPLLPVVIGGSLTSTKEVKRNPYIIITALLVSVVLFTLIIDTIASFIYVPTEFWRYFGATLILILGVIFLFPNLWYKLPFVSKFSISSNVALGKHLKKRGMGGDILIGASLGPVFTSCSPTWLLIVATVLPASFFDGLSYLFAYALGLGVVLLFITLVGQKAIERLGILADERGTFKKTMGVILIVIALVIFVGWDKVFAEYLLDLGFIDITQFELEAK